MKEGGTINKVTITDEPRSMSMNIWVNRDLEMIHLDFGTATPYGTHIDTKIAITAKHAQSLHKLLGKVLRAKE